MAKQSGPHFITGTVAGICFYRLNGKFYTRRKSSLSRKRVKRDPKFALTRMYAGMLGRASQIASAVYRELPAAKKKHALYRALTGKALQALKEGLDEAAIFQQLKQTVVQAAPVAVPAPKPVAVLPGKGVVRTVWRSGGKLVVECREAVARKRPVRKALRPGLARQAVNDKGQLTWTVIRKDREAKYFYDLEEYLKP